MRAAVLEAPGRVVVHEVRSESPWSPCQDPTNFP